MQCTLKRNSDTNVTLSITADAETLNKIREAALRRFNKPDLKIPGFRGGKAPLDLVEKNIDQQLLQNEFIDTTLNHYYTQAIIKENLRVAGQPQVNLKKFVPYTTFEFDVTVDVLGEVKLPNYKSLRKKMPAVTVTVVDVNKVIDSLKIRLADRRVVERGAKNGDQATIDFKGVDDKGKPVDGASGQGYPLLLGSNSFIPGFETNLIGQKTGEEKAFTIPFPKDYGVKALQSKKVTFTVTITKLEELAEPKLDDDFAAKAGPFKTLKELKADIKKQLTLEKTQHEKQNFQNEILRELAAKTKVAIPDSVIDEQVERAEQDERKNVTYRGQTWQEHLDSEGVTEEEHKKQKRPVAEEQVRMGVMLGAIGDKENIEVTPEELEVRMQILKGQYTDKAMQVELDKPEARQDIAARLRTEKILDTLTEIVTQTKKQEQ